MSNVFVFRSRRFTRLATAFAVGAFALVAVPGPARAAVIAQNLPIDQGIMRVPVVQQGETTEDVLAMSLTSGGAPVFLLPVQEGDLSLADPGQTCVIPNPLSNGLAGTGCSEVVRLVNVPLPPPAPPGTMQGQIWVVNDHSPPADTAGVPAFTDGFPIFVAASITEIDAGAGDSTGSLYRTIYTNRGFATLGYRSDLPKFATQTPVLSDELVVNTPAMPPAALFGLGALLVAGIGVGIGRRRSAGGGMLNQ